MKRHSSIGFIIVVVALVIASGVGFLSQRLQTESLRTDLALARLETDELRRLTAENERLRGLQLPAAKLEAMRADHAAVTQLRTELETLKKATPAAER